VSTLICDKQRPCCVRDSVPKGDCGPLDIGYFHARGALGFFVEHGHPNLDPSMFPKCFHGNRIEWY
jgi:hypothetical protein